MKCITKRTRAVDEHDKAQKRNSILEAAKSLFSHDTDSLPSVISIARAAGLAKGTVYLYFRTKEEIFLALLSEQYEQLLQAMSDMMEKQDQPDQIIHNFVALLTDYISENHMFMPLASMASSVLENNVDDEIILQFKRMLAKRVNHIGETLHQRLPQLSIDQSAQLLLSTNALIIGLWQMHIWPQRLGTSLDKSEFRNVIPDLSTDITKSIENLWRGALL